MLPALFLECAVRAALLVAGTAVVLVAMRVQAPAVKHRVWTAVLLCMLLLPAWTVWGPRAPLRVLPPLAENSGPSLPPANISSASLLLPRAAVAGIPAPPAHPRSSPLMEFLLGVYLLGLFALLSRLAIGTLKAHQLIRQAVLRDARLTSASLAAPVTVGWFHPAEILPEGWPAWPSAQLDAVLAHEQEHARRRDPLVQWLALLNRAVFWFHPAAWWLERQLSSLAEQACDAAVLARGSDPRAYAQTLMDMARAVVRAGGVNVIGMAMPGASFPRRIRQIIEACPAPRVSRARLACLAAACAITCAAFAAGTLEHLRPNIRPAFDVASITRSTVGANPLPSRIVSRPTDPANFPLAASLLITQRISLRGCIEFAYNLTPGQIAALQLPPWADSDRYDIQARADGHPTQDRIRLMMQSLLADRFQLAAHYETRQPPPGSPGALPASLNVSPPLDVPAPLDVLVVDHVEQPSAN